MADEIEAVPRPTATATATAAAMPIPQGAQAEQSGGVDDGISPSSTPLQPESAPPRPPPPPLVKWYRTLNNHTLNASSMLATSLLLTAYRSDRMGASPYCHQLMGTLLFIAWLPPTLRHNLHERLPYLVTIPLTTVWLICCGLPVARVVLMDLLTGHRRADMEWYSAVWRVYAILALWLTVCASHKKWLGPAWTRFSRRWFGGGRHNALSVTARGARADEAMRRARLARIQQRVAILLRRKKRGERVLRDREAERQGVRNRLDELGDGAGVRDGDDGHAVTEEEGLLTESGKNLDVEIARVREDLEDVEDQLRLGQMEWTEALNVNNFRTFYR